MLYRFIFDPRILLKLKASGICIGLLSFLFLPAAAQAQLSTSTNNGAVTITGYGGPHGPVIIPDVTNGLPVTGIADYAFYNNSSITSVTVGTNVATIGQFVFNGSSATSISLPASLTSIGVETFSYCTGLTAITVDPNNAVYSSVGGVLFNHSKTTLLQYPNAVSGSYTIPNGVTSIGDYAFYESTRLTGVTIPNSVTSIGNYSFWVCGLTSVTIPNSVTTIGQEAFADCFSLSSLSLGTNVTSIGYAAFYFCFLGSVNIPSSVTSIGAEAFAAYQSLTAINVDPANPAYSSLNGVLFDKNHTTLLEAPGALSGSYTVPGTVTSIGDWAFFDCKHLTSATIPNSVTSIGYNTFANCTSLSALYFSGNAPACSTAFNYSPVTAYYVPGTIGWSTFSANAGIPTVPIATARPQILGAVNGNGPGVQNNQFSFMVSWATNLAVVVEACSNPANPSWQPLQTNTLANGSFNFSDAQWSNHPARFYRVRTP